MDTVRHSSSAGEPCGRPDRAVCEPAALSWVAAARERPPKSAELASGALLSRLERDEIRFELLRQWKCASCPFGCLAGKLSGLASARCSGYGKCWRATITGREYAETASRATACCHLFSRRIRHLRAFPWSPPSPDRAPAC